MIKVERSGVSFIIDESKRGEYAAKGFVEIKPKIAPKTTPKTKTSKK